MSGPRPAHGDFRGNARIARDGKQAVIPASTGNATPVIHCASGEARKAMASAMSDGSQYSPPPSQPRDRSSIVKSTPGSGIALVIGVLVPPGQTAFTRTPSLASSSASARVMPMTPCLDAQYGALKGTPTRPAAEATLTMEPLVASRCGRAAWHMKKVPLRLIWMIRFHSSGVKLATGAMRSTPATLQRTSSCPPAATAALTMAAH